MTPAARLDSGNRSFLTLVGIVLGFRTVIMLLACCVVCVVGFQLVAAGPSILWTGGGWMLPAAMLAGLVVATTITVVVRAIQELWADGNLRRRLRTHTIDTSSGLQRLAAHSGLAGRVRTVRDSATFAFTYGFIKPNVVVSSALVQALSEPELAAVLAHESAHVRGRDPLKVLLARLVVSREFYLPVLRHLSARFVSGRELAADRKAAASCGVRPLAGALMRVLDPPRWATATPAAAMATSAALDARISQLETGTEPAAPAPPRGSMAGSVAAALLVVAAAVDAAIVIQQLCMRTM